jgi:hypothetical protein
VDHGRSGPGSVGGIFCSRWLALLLSFVVVGAIGMSMVG